MSNIVSDNEVEGDETENEMEEDFDMGVNAMVMAGATMAKAIDVIVETRYLNGPIEQPLKRRSVFKGGYSKLEQKMKEDPENFRQLYRMYPDVFLKLCCIIREKTILRDTRHVSIEEMLATFMSTVGHNSRHCVTRSTFQRSHWTASKNFNRMLKALIILAPDMMAKPGMPAKIRDTNRFYPYFKNCIGAIDGSHIPAMVPIKDAARYRNRHGSISQNVMAACNFDLEFMYVLSGWERSAHDSKILNDALTRRNGIQIPQGKYFLVDCGYPNRRQFLAPYRGVRYHLQDFTGQGRDPENANELYNLRHASLRNAVERIFGVFKSRFVTSKTAPPFPYKTQAEIVLACAGVHNFLRKECRMDEFPLELDDADSPSSSSSTDDYDHVIQTQEQQRDEANEWRASIAADLWNDAMDNMNAN